MPRTRMAVALAVTAAVAAASGCSSDDSAPKPDRPVAVALDHSSLPSPLTIGVVVSLTSAPGQGSEWVESAEGARVAAFRYQLDGRTVKLDVVDDHGTSDGAVGAVKSLVKDGAAGIVMATTGSHLTAALASAVSAKTAVLMPYGPVPGSSPGEGIWSTAPSATGIVSGLQDAEERLGVSRPYAITASGGPMLDLQVVGHSAADDVHAAVKAAVKAARQQSADSIFVDGPAHVEAEVVSALQGAGVSTPILLGPAAESPTFATQLAAAGGTMSGLLVTAGADATDASAAGGSARQQVAAAFFQALRMTAQNPSIHDFFAGQPFSAHAAYADIASHDAVVALANAAAKAGTEDPAAVRDALSSLKLGPDDGLAGPALDFSSSSALPDSAVVPLQATTLDPGMRGDLDAKRELFWFSIADDGAGASADAAPAS